MRKGKIAELRERMIHHGILDDRAVVVLCADELQELLDDAEDLARAGLKTKTMTTPSKATKSKTAKKVIVHNHIAHGINTPNGWNGFRKWTQVLEPGLVLCSCGWSGRPHYRVRAKRDIAKKRRSATSASSAKAK